MSTYDRADYYSPSDLDEPKQKEITKMNITILSVELTTVPTAKGSYQKAQVAYKNNTFQGKVEGKVIMSFGATAASFKVLSQATAGESYEVSIVKNDKGYNDWVSMSKAGAADVGTTQAAKPAATSGSTASPRSTYETPEERAQRQIYIIRQSSISAAVSSLAAGAKAAVEPSKVLAVAKQYEDYVLGKGATGFDDLPDFDEKEFPDVV